jgi:hypothetical protein
MMHLAMEKHEADWDGRWETRPDESSTIISMQATGARTAEMRHGEPFSVHLFHICSPSHHEPGQRACHRQTQGRGPQTLCRRRLRQTRVGSACSDLRPVALPFGAHLVLFPMWSWEPCSLATEALFVSLTRFAANTASQLGEVCMISTRHNRCH